MNTMTMRALMLGLVIALWAWLADVARLHVSLWAGVVALGCFFAAGGGGPGGPKNIVVSLGGGVGGVVAPAGLAAVGGGQLGPPPRPGATPASPRLQHPVPLLSLSAG